MQSNIFAKAAPSLKEKKFNIDISAFLEFLGKYKSGDWIYPSAIHRELKIDVRTVYMLMESLRDSGFVEQYLEIYCPHCSRYTGRYFKTVADVEEEISCPHCDYEITDPVEHAVIVYRVR